MTARYAILEHDYPVRHWDFMLEDGDSLRTWRLENAPVVGGVIPAEESFPHRLLYLGYEGPLGVGRVLCRRTMATGLPLCRYHGMSISACCATSATRSNSDWAEMGKEPACMPSTSSATHRPRSFTGAFDGNQTRKSNETTVLQ